MDVLVEIRQKLLNGKQPAELIKEDYAKSSVYYVAKKFRNFQSGIPGLPIDDELTELRRRKDIIKLEKEKLPERVTKLEADVHRLNQQLPDLVAKCYASLYMMILRQHVWNEDEGLQEAMRTGNDFLKHSWTSH